MTFVNKAASLLIGASLLASPLAAQDSQPAAANPAEARMAQVIDHYRNADTVASKVNVAIKVDRGGEVQDMGFDGDLRIDKPNSYFRSSSEDGKVDVLSIANGTGTLYIEEYDALVAMKADTIEDAVDNDMRAGMMILPMLATAESAAAFMEDMSLAGLELAGTGEYGGVAVQHVKAMSDDQVLTFHVSAEGDPILHGLSVVPQEGVTVEIAFADQTVGQPIDAALFAYKPTKDAKTYDSMDEFMKAMRGPEPSDALLGKAAPAFELPTLEGQPFKIADAKGKVVVLDFWATWCGPCVRALPILTDVTTKMADQGVVFYAVNLRESEDLVRGFQEKQSLTFPVLMDKEGAVGDQYFVQGIPQTVIIGKDGTVQAVHIGFNPALGEQLTKELSTLVEGKPLVEAPAEGGAGE